VRPLVTDDRSPEGPLFDGRFGLGSAVPALAWPQQSTQCSVQLATASARRARGARM